MGKCPYRPTEVHSVKSSQPGINNDDTGPLEVLDIAGDNREPVNERGGSNQGIDFIASVGDVQMGAACRDGIVDG